MRPERLASANRRQLIAAGLGLAATGRAAAATAPAAAAAPLQVVASLSILADMARQVGGDAAAVHALVGPDIDAHAFQPAPSDAQRLARADLVLINGLGFEGWIDRLVRVSGYRGPVAVLSRGIEPRRAGGHADPHAWQDPRLGRRYVENLRAALAAARPGEAAGFAARAAAYAARIDEIDRRARAEIDAVPAAERRAITPHAAFGYLGDAYGVTFLAPRGWAGEGDASAAAVAGVIRQIRAQRVRALFVENTTDRRLIERIARETGVAIGGTLYSDALSAPGGAADTYLRMLAHNTHELAAALRAGTGRQARP